MKETIYTIPINDAFESECDCPLCYIQHKINNELVEAEVGAAMMEPDHREKTNEKGFCEKHITQMHEMQRVLPLSLVLQSHIELQNKNILSLFSENGAARKLFGSKSSKKEAAKKLISYIEAQQNKCAVCEALNATMSRYADNTVYLWQKEPDFREKFNKKGICVRHLKLLLTAAVNGLPDKEFDGFFDTLSQKAGTSFTDMYNDLTLFVNSFDYRFKDELPDKAKSATIRAANTFIGSDL